MPGSKPYTDRQALARLPPGTNTDPGQEFWALRARSSYQCPTAAVPA